MAVVFRGGSNNHTKQTTNNERRRTPTDRPTDEWTRKLEQPTYKAKIRRSSVDGGRGRVIGCWLRVGLGVLVRGRVQFVLALLPLPYWLGLRKIPAPHEIRTTTTQLCHVHVFVSRAAPHDLHCKNPKASVQRTNTRTNKRASGGGDLLACVSSAASVDNDDAESKKLSFVLFWPFLLLLLATCSGGVGPHIHQSEVK